MPGLEVSNMRLLAHDTLAGFGGIGEGMSLQLARDGRRILWLAHELAPKNFTGVDVTDLSKPRVVVQTDLPHRNVRSNSLEVCGDLIAVAYQTSTHGLQPAGIELFDIANPEEPRSAGFLTARLASRGVHQLWFVDGRTIHFAGGAPDFKPRTRLMTSVIAPSTSLAPRSHANSAGGGIPARKRATMRRHRRVTPPSISAFAPTTPTSIPNAWIALMSAISTAAR